jgi:hypothetical protein
MIKIELPATGKIVEVDERDWTICSDSWCDGFAPIMTLDEDDSDVPVSYKTEEEATKELEDDPEFYEDCFVCQMSEVGHKAVFYG